MMQGCQGVQGSEMFHLLSREDAKPDYHAPPWPVGLGKPRYQPNGREQTLSQKSLRSSEAGPLCTLEET